MQEMCFIFDMMIHNHTQGLDNNVAAPARARTQNGLDVDTIAAKVIKTADAGIVYTLDAIATSLPNLPKMVGTAEYAASGIDIFAALLARHAFATFGYCLLAFLVSYFFLKSREIAA